MYDERIIQIVDARIAKAAQQWTARGTVVDRDTVGPGATVVFDGDAIAVQVKVPGHVHIIEGDRVVLMLVATTWVVVGTFARRQLGEASARTNGPVSSNTTTSATYVDAPADAIATITKRYDGTAVRVAMIADAFATAVTTVTQFAVRVAGLAGTDTATTYTATDWFITQFAFNTASQHHETMGVIRVVNMPAGQYTLTPRWRRSAGTGTLTQDNNSYVTVEADEIFRLEAN